MANNIGETFTGRQNERQLFTAAFNETARSGKSQFVNYYGQEGIGKTALTGMLTAYAERFGMAYALLDCGVYSSINKFMALTAIANGLYETGGYRFFRLRTAVSTWRNMTGMTTDIPFSGISFFNKKIGDEIKEDMAGEEPYLDTEELKSLSEFTETLGKMKAADICASLDSFFTDDLLYGLKKTARPVVIFIDDFDRLVSSFEEESMHRPNEVWLSRLMGTLPGTVWVISGTAPLSDEYPKGILRHELKPFDETEIQEFMSKRYSSVKETESIRSMEEAIPLELEMTAELLYRGIDLPEDRTDTAAALISALGSGEKDNAVMLAALQRWTGAKAAEIGKTMDSVLFSPVDVDALGKAAYITAGRGNGSILAMNRTMRKAFLDDPSAAEIVPEANRKALEYYLLKTVQNEEDPAEGIFGAISAFVGLSRKDVDAFGLQGFGILISNVAELSGMGRADEEFEAAEELFFWALREKRPEYLSIAANCYSAACHETGDYQLEKNVCISWHDNMTASFGEDSREAQTALSSLVFAYFDTGELKEAEETANRLYDKQLSQWGEDDEETQRTAQMLEIIRKNLQQ
ncbi:MAG: AAA family ATPase [Eubacteriaceae bacterium]|nr:AAA family ATPase [Eubacteriaceae bacterium]